MSTKRTLRILGIETSCDETAASLVDVRRQMADGRSDFGFCVWSNVVASQVRTHARYGGVVPEVAAREHVVKIMPVIEEACRRGGFYTRPSGRQGLKPCPTGIDAIAVTAGPGLLPSLAVGVETARTLAVAWEKPLIAVNHSEGHVLSSLLHTRENFKSLLPRRMRLRRKISNLKFPALTLVVSGGHTELLLMRGWGRYECIGATRDDAAGEAFDKVGKLLGLPYPGGPAVARAAEGGDPTAFDFPRPMIDSADFEFSFSGLKTAVRYAIERRGGVSISPPPPGTVLPLLPKQGELEGVRIPMRVGRSRGGGARATPSLLSRTRNRTTPSHSPSSRARGSLSRGKMEGEKQTVANLCASFQQAVVDTLVAKTVHAAEHCRVKTVLLGGGVAANAALRSQLGAALAARLPSTDYRLPLQEYTGDNAAMIAAAGGVRLLLGQQTPWERLTANANWELGR